MLVLSSVKRKQERNQHVCSYSNLNFPPTIQDNCLSEKGTELKTKNDIDCSDNVNDFLTLYVLLFLFC